MCQVPSAKADKRTIARYYPVGLPGTPYQAPPPPRHTGINYGTGTPYGTDTARFVPKMGAFVLKFVPYCREKRGVCAALRAPGARCVALRVPSAKADKRTIARYCPVGTP